MDVTRESENIHQLQLGRSQRGLAPSGLPSGQRSVPVTTVHGVKGETHDVTIFVCPDTNAEHCPSTIWWSQDEKEREERRIAYVAMTRTQGDLILCVSDDCYGRLCESRKPFVDSFECMTVDEFVDRTGKSVS